MDNLNSIGITINQKKLAKRSLTGEFFEDLFLRIDVNKPKIKYNQKNY